VPAAPAAKAAQTIKIRLIIIALAEPIGLRWKPVSN
jgi:hypothetical protein